MLSNLNHPLIFRRSLNKFVNRNFSAKSNKTRIAFIGLGHMGSKMALNLAQDGHLVTVYDASEEATKKCSSEIQNWLKNNGQSETSLLIRPAKTIAQIFDGESNPSVVFTMLPNDNIVQEVSSSLFSATKNLKGSPNCLHVSCSTVSPVLARKLLSQSVDNNWGFVSSPVFARPDGIAKRQATYMISGPESYRAKAAEFLEKMGRVVDFGDDIAAANVTKLSGNYLISASIEAIAEAMAFAEKNNVDREAVMKLLSSTIFDCLIYKGYGQRVSERDHKPGGFSLELGYKDVTLVQQAARDAKVPMPFLSVLVDRYTAARAKGRAGMDWSAIGLNVAEDAGIDISKDLEKNNDFLKNEKK